MNTRKLILHIANSNHKFDHLVPTIEGAISQAEEYAVPALQITTPIDVIVAGINSNVKIDQTLPPAERVGGVVYWGDFLFLNIAETSPTIDFGALFTMICHELTHAKHRQWLEAEDLSEHGELFSNTINEGVAICFEVATAKQFGYTPTQATSEIINAPSTEVAKIAKVYQPLLETTDYDRDIFYKTGNQELPKWSLYKLGYARVHQYLETSGRPLLDLITMEKNKLRDLIDL